jgi:hypothetical protein
MKMTFGFDVIVFGGVPPSASATATKHCKTLNTGIKNLNVIT